jgi:hypothetical protein
MPFLCPTCNTASLEITSSIHLNADSRSDEIALQVIDCNRCGFRGLAVYEESHRGALGNVSWEHMGYRLDKDNVKFVKDLIELCPNPSDEDCTCSSHLSLGYKDANGRWAGVRNIPWQDYFWLQSA